LAAQSSAQTADQKSYPAHYCVAAGTSPPGIVRLSDQAYLTGTGNMLCPLIKDRSGGTFNQTANARVYDSSTTADLSCTLFIYDQSGSSTDFSSDTTSGSGGFDTLNFTVDTGSAPSSSTYFFQCFWPSSNSNLRMINYRMTENNTNG
jgi:hypothetical protein